MEEQVELEQSENVEVAPPEETESHEATEEAVHEEPQERNWRELRKQKSQLEERVKYQEELLAEMMRNHQKAVQQPPEIDELDEISDDDYISKGQVAKLVEKRAAAIVRKETEEFYRKQESSRFMERLKGKYSDFDQVVNAESVAYLEEKDPELAESIAELKDPYKIGLQTYKYLKAMGLSSKAKESPRTKETKKKLEKNEDFVQSPISYERRPMAQAFRMTQEEKDRAYDEMMFYAGQGGI